MPWIITAIAVLVVLSVVGGVALVMNLGGGTNVAGGGGSPGASTTVSGATSRPTASASRKTSASGGTGTYAPVADLCAKTDLSPLGDWAAKNNGQSKEQSSVPDMYDRATCSYELRSGAGIMITLDLETKVYTKLSDAKDDYTASHDFDKDSYFDADLTGLGDQAYGTDRDWDIGSKTSEYDVNLQVSNLRMELRLVTFGTSFTPKDQIKQKAITETTSILAALSKN